MKVRKAIINLLDVDALLHIPTWELSGAMKALYEFACVACGKPLATVMHITDCGHTDLDRVDYLKYFELRPGYAPNAGRIYVWKRPPRRPLNMWAAAARGDDEAFAQCQMSSPDFPVEWLRTIVNGLRDSWGDGQHGRILDTRHSAVVRCYRCKEHNLLDPNAARAETIAHADPTKYVLREFVKHERGEPSTIRIEVTQEAHPTECRSLQ